MSQSEQARSKAFILYEGKKIAHHSCGICIAATFCVPTRPFQALRRGVVTGEGECGAIVAGRVVLGYFLGDPDPAGALRPVLLEAMQYYEKLWRVRTEPGKALVEGQKPDIICNTLVGHLANDFWGEERMDYREWFQRGVVKPSGDASSIWGVWQKTHICSSDEDLTGPGPVIEKLCLEEAIPP